MKKIKVGFGRIYNAKGCLHLGSENVSLKIPVGDIEINISIGPNLKHKVMTMKFGPPQHKDEKLRQRGTRAKGYQHPPSHIFPADVYFELVATQFINVEEDLANSFLGNDKEAREKIFKLVKQKEERFSKAVDYAAGYLGLRLHYLLVTTPIIEQYYAYKGNGYSISGKIDMNVTDSFETNNNDLWINEMKKKLPMLLPKLEWEKAAGILSWLLRAWAAEDTVLKFVSFFTSLESVIPSINQDMKKWEVNRHGILKLVKKYEEDESLKEYTCFLVELKPPSIPLFDRFNKWAANLAMYGWEKDVAAFKRFSIMRNQLVHAGQSKINLKVTVDADDVRTLEDITERYVSFALYGDANVYKTKKSLNRK